ncbi:MAG TPA: DUF177 domain-containing protein [Sphingomicrobium sp.]|nr:DUF177 domain-containing protein [Sphingomicrobium sp.]
MSDFGHRLTLDRIRDGDRIDLIADEAECAAVCGRLGLSSLDRLAAHAVLTREADRIGASGRLKAALEQRCVATSEPMAVHVDEAFELRFVPAPAAGDEEVELDASELDLLFHDGQSIDLGAAIADSLALALDPYPRSADAGAALQQAGVISEEEAGPFAALAALKAKLPGES